MKKILFFTLFMLIAVPICHASEEQKILFCEDFDSNWNPVNQGDSFSRKTVSWIAKLEKPFGTPQITTTVYVNDGKKEKLLHRENIEVSPKWNTLAIRNMEFPHEGDFIVSLTNINGEHIITGCVKIVNSGGADIHKKREIKGGIFEELYNKYAPKKR